MEIGHICIIGGLILLIIGILLVLGIKIPLPGTLPGDIIINRDHGVIVIPITTSILLSIILALLFRFINR